MKRLGLVLLCLLWLSAAVQARPWVSAYYLSGNQGSGPLPVDQVDFSAMSHLIHFGIFINADGTLNPAKEISAAQSREVLQAAHQAGVKVLVCLGTDEDAVRMRRALQDDVRPHLVQNLVQFVMDRGYDGLDLDVEPLEDDDVPNYEKLVHELRRALNAQRPGLLLTAAVGSEPELFARIQGDMDQINLMTYDISGKYPGFKSWYNAGLYGSWPDVMEDGSDYPSVDQMVHQFIDAGVARSKLGIGTAFYGYVWSGVSGPRQSLDDTVKVDDGVDYKDIMDQYYQPSRYHWDDQAQAPWLGIESDTPSERKFISYDDERLCARKQQYVRDEGLGGSIIWELGSGYRNHQPPGQRDSLLQAVKRAWLMLDTDHHEVDKTP